MHDAAASGRKFRALSVVDPYTRECLALEVATSMGSRQVTRVLERIVAERGTPGAIRSDNGPEFTSRYFVAWCVERKIELVHIEPGKPGAECARGEFSWEAAGRVLERELVSEFVRKIAAWREEYNQERPHSSLGYCTPAAFAASLRGKEGRGKDARLRTPSFPPRLGIPPKARDSHFPTATAATFRP